MSQSVRFTASTNMKSVSTDIGFQLEFKLENADGTNFTPPDFAGLNVISGPSRSMSTMIVNGRMSKSMTYTYIVQAKREGKLRIGPASISVNGRKMESNALTLDVVRGQPQGSGAITGEVPADQDVFMRAEVDTNIAYPGQQIRLDYVLYSRINVRNYNVLSEDNYDTYYMRHLANFLNRAERVMINGEQYSRQVLRSMALFPQQTGTDTIQPLSARLGIGVDDPNNWLSFGMRTVPKMVSTDAVPIEVRPLPGGAPKGFDGAVGQYTIDGNIDKNQLTTDDALVLTVTISGNGDARRWSPPDGSSLSENFEVYEPRVIDDDSQDMRGGIFNRKRIEYRLIPKVTGRMDVRLPFTFFNPDSAKFETIYTRSFTIAVKQGTRKPNADAIASDFSETPQELQPLKKPATVSKGQSRFFLSIPYFLLLLLPLPGLGYLLARRQRERAFDRQSPEEKRRARAAEEARKVLSSAGEALDNGDARTFYMAVSRAVIGYIAVKLRIPHSEMTRANLESRMLDHGVDPSLVDRVMEKVRYTDQALYAGKGGADDMSDFYHAMVELFIELEAKLDNKTT